MQLFVPRIDLRHHGEVAGSEEPEVEPNHELPHVFPADKYHVHHGLVEKLFFPRL